LHKRFKIITLQNITKINKLISIKWHIAENSHIGKSTCGKYFIEIINNGSHFDYIITETKSDKIRHKNAKPHFSIEDAKRVIMSLLYLKHTFI